VSSGYWTEHGVVEYSVENSVDEKVLTACGGGGGVISIRKFYYLSY